MAMPATERVIGTPALSMLSVPPHTDAMEDDPLLSNVSETTRTVYGNSSLLGMTRSSARSARWPWPTSRRPVPRRPVSPTENGGKL